MKWISFAALVLVIAVTVPTLVQASDGGEAEVWAPTGDGTRVGLIIGSSDHEKAGRWREELASRIKEEGGVLVLIVNEVSAEDSTEAEAVISLRDEGQEAYFFQGPRPARELLEEEVMRRLEVSRSWMKNEAATAAMLEAGLYLVRAAQDLGQDRFAETVMHRLVAALPAHRPDPNLFPPDVMELFDAARAHQAQEATRLVVAGLDAPERGCRGAVNGAAVQGSEIYISPGRGYLVGHLCAEEEGSRWWRWRVEAGGTRSVTAMDPTISAQEIATTLKQAAQTADFDALFYVGPGDCGAEVCLAARSGDGRRALMEFQPLESSAAGEAWAYIAWRGSADP